MQDLQLSLVEHLGELRKRIIVICIALTAGSVLSYTYINLILSYVVRPAGGLKFIYLSPPELFMANIKISIILGGLIASPIILYQIWAFLKPGLKPKEKKYILFALFMGIVFFFLGSFFAYKVILPMTINFFVKMSINQIQPTFSFANYISFCGTLIFSFGLVFQLPLLILLLNQLNLVSTDNLKHYRKYFILVTFIVAAILTPPDAISQTLMALPMIVLYEFSLALAIIINKQRKKLKS